MVQNFPASLFVANLSLIVLKPASNAVKYVLYWEVTGARWAWVLRSKSGGYMLSIC